VVPTDGALWVIVQAQRSAPLQGARYTIKLKDTRSQDWLKIRKDVLLRSGRAKKFCRAKRSLREMRHVDREKAPKNQGKKGGRRKPKLKRGKPQKNRKMEKANKSQAQGRPREVP